jgi:hypothetical protein
MSFTQDQLCDWWDRVVGRSETGTHVDVGGNVFAHKYFDFADEQIIEFPSLAPYSDDSEGGASLYYRRVRSDESAPWGMWKPYTFEHE